MSLLTLLKKLKFEAKSLCARHPALTLLHKPFVWWQQYKIWTRYPDESIWACVVGDHTEFVLDGFQGSANSYATEVFVESQSRPVNVAHHLHSPAQVIAGVERGLPVLITIRPPVDACLSLTSRWPYLSMTQALRSYIGYYDTLRPYADRIVWSPFESTTRDLSAVLVDVNDRFATDFNLVSATVVDDIRRRHGPQKSESEKRRRDQIKQEKRLELSSTTCSTLAADAHALYDRLASFFPTSRRRSDHIHTRPPDAHVSPSPLPPQPH